jgi:hypothetical protein
MVITRLRRPKDTEERDWQEIEANNVACVGAKG